VSADERERGRRKITIHIRLLFTCRYYVEYTGLRLRAKFVASVAQKCSVILPCVCECLIIEKEREKKNERIKNNFLSFFFFFVSAAAAAAAAVFYSFCLSPRFLSVVGRRKQHNLYSLCAL
jgi:hypothetical protein